MPTLLRFTRFTSVTDYHMYSGPESTVEIKIEAKRAKYTEVLNPNTALQVNLLPFHHAALLKPVVCKERTLRRNFSKITHGTLDTSTEEVCSA